jgi:dephospho-CoA kinase
VIKEAAILIESGAYKGVDEIIVVSASEETRIRRVMKRDQVDEGKVRERMSAQLSDEQRESYADHTIDNNDDQLVIPQILQIHEDINSRANS